MINRLTNAWNYLLDHGLIRTLSECRYRISELKNDRYFGIETSYDILLETLQTDNEDCTPYAPISYDALNLALREVEPSHEYNAFLDFGSGKGRAVIVAATLPFRRSIGVEYAPELAAMSRDNIERAQHRLTCADIEIFEMDATEFNIPCDVSVIHFYNPFVGETLSTVAGNIADSLRTTPRKMTILFANADDFERILKEDKCIPMEWITKTNEFTWPYFKQDTPYSNSYRIYSLDSR